MLKRGSSQLLTVSVLWAGVAGIAWGCVGDSPGSPSDAGTDATDAGNAVDSALVDARDGATEAAAACDLLKPFNAPVLLPNVDTAAEEYNARFALGDLALFFNSTASDAGVGGDDLWTASRANRSAPFGAATLVPSLNTTSNDYQATLTADGLTLYLVSDRPGTLGLGDIWVTERALTSANFGVPATVTNVNGGSDDRDPYVRGDGKVLYFASNRTGAGSYDIYVSARGGNGAFGAPVALAGINSSALESAPVLSADELTIYFASDRTGGAGLGDVWVAHRSSVNDGFNTPTVVAELNSPTNEYPTSLSADECSILITSKRAGGLGGSDVWIASRPK